MIVETGATAAVAAMLAAGCGGGGDDTPPAVTAPETTVADPAWSIPYLMEREPGKTDHPSVAMSAGGDTIAVFAQQAGNRNAVFATHANVNTMAIGMARAIDNPATSAQPPLVLHGKTQTATQVAMNPATGDAIAVWSATSDGIPHVWAAKYVKASDTWSAPARLDAAPAGASYPSIAMNGSGNAVAIWAETLDGDATRGVSAAYLANGVWSRPMRLSTRTTGVAPQLGMDAMGNAIAVWTERNAEGSDDILVTRISSSGAAEAARVIDTSPAPASLPAVAVSWTGNALAAWVQDDQGTTSIHASLFRTGAWSTPQRLKSLDGESFAPAVALNASGGFVAWEQRVNFSGNLLAARLTPEYLWEEPVRVFTRGGYMPVVRMRDNGDAMLIWLAAHTQFAKFSAATASWGGTTNLSPYNCGSGHAIAMDSVSGKAIAAWVPSTCDLSNDLYAAFFK